jgi:Arc/MetJ-type ribon-helix-helix transcriptional regulator
MQVKTPRPLQKAKNHLYTIHRDGETMKGASPQIRDKSGDSEKITINLGYVDLGRVDLLVREGFYSSRTDFIRTAIRGQLGAHADTVAQSLVRHTLELGLRDYSRADLEAVKSAGEHLHVKVLGLVRIAPDVTPDLALAAIGSITVLGALQASAEVKSALAERVH